MLSRLRNRFAPSTAGAALPGPNTRESWQRERDWLARWGCPLNVVAGEARRQTELRRLARCDGPCLRLVNVLLEHEPSNPVDSNAIGASVERVHVGYLRADIASQIVEGHAAHGLAVSPFVVAGVMRGGWDHGGEQTNIGVHLWLDRRVSPGPEIDIDADELEVSWPPHDEELDLVG
jgi:hypothetical protein